MYPRKGVIQVGSDADIVIWDPAMKKILKDEDEFSNAKYSSYAGMDVTGFPKTTVRRGEVVYDNGKIVGKAGSGRFIPGGKFQRPAHHAAARHCWVLWPAHSRHSQFVTSLACPI
jgi:dihydropyrimidinase